MTTEGVDVVRVADRVVCALGVGMVVVFGFLVHHQATLDPHAVWCDPHLVGCVVAHR